MITDAKSGVIKQPGKGLLDAKLSTAAVDLKDAIVQYTSDRMEAQYLGRKFVTDLDRITDGLTLRSTPDTHNKINKWWVERQRQAQEAS